jgi:hypothetical protein
MKKTFLFKLFLMYTMFIFQLHSQIDSTSSWKIDTKVADITIYTCDVKNSKFLAFKAVTFIATNLENILAVFEDVENYSNWFAYTNTSKLIYKQKNKIYAYVETTFPWPFQNRDMVYELTRRIMDNGSIEIYQKGIPNHIAPITGITRIKKANGWIHLQPISNGTLLTYVFHSEHGENLPYWLANETISELPIKTLSQLKQIVE